MRQTQENMETAWKNCQQIVESAVDKTTYETIIKYAKLKEIEPDHLEISLLKSWQKDHLERHNYIEIIKDILSNYIGRKINITLSLNSSAFKPVVENLSLFSTTEMSEGMTEEIQEPPKEKEKEKISFGKNSQIPLDPRYTFDSYIVGSGNRLAHAAAQAVAEAPAKAYNPLFIYGGVGLGKTHLMNAIGHSVIRKNKSAKVVYVSMEKFVNDFIESIKYQKMTEFRKKYRSVNLLLIDDIQFIINKEQTQEEFFHTFNELHSAKSQIIITSDRHPRDIATLEDRLRSRFEWGLLADIQPPDLETRIAILRKKAEIDHVNVPPEVLSYIAEKISSNIRELEGALNRIICYASLNSQKINLDLAHQALKEVLPDSQPRNITIPLIQEKVCEYFDIKISELISSRREKKLVFPRHIAMYLSREVVGASLLDVAKAFGGKDHTTVINACKNIMKSKKDPSVKNMLDNIITMLKSPA